MAQISGVASCDSSEAFPTLSNACSPYVQLPRGLTKQQPYPTLSNTCSPFLLYSPGEATTNITLSHSLIHLFPPVLQQKYHTSQSLVHLFYFTLPGRLLPISHSLIRSFIFFPRCDNKSITPPNHLLTFFTSRSGEATTNITLSFAPLSFPPGAATKVSHPFEHLFTFFTSLSREGYNQYHTLLLAHSSSQVLQPKFPPLSNTCSHYVQLPRVLTEQQSYHIHQNTRSLYVQLPRVLTKQQSNHILHNTRSPFFIGPNLRGGELRQQRGVSHSLKRLFTFFYFPKSPGWRAATAARRFPLSQTPVHLMSLRVLTEQRGVSHPSDHSIP